MHICRSTGAAREIANSEETMGQEKRSRAALTGGRDFSRRNALFTKRYKGPARMFAMQHRLNTRERNSG